ncbi:MAG: ParB-like protein [Synechococcus sp.]
MSLPHPTYTPIPKAGDDSALFKVAIADLRPTQWSVGFAEIWARQIDFAKETEQQHLRYLRRKPVPVVKDGTGNLWMLDRHHRLRALLEQNPGASTWAYLVDDRSTSSSNDVLAFLQEKGWLYLIDGRGKGPHAAKDLPESLMGLDDDPYRSLVWKLKKEGLITPQPQIPYHEFRWGAWLRRRPLPPFSSRALEPALPPARRLVCSSSAGEMPGWRG